MVGHFRDGVLANKPENSPALYDSWTDVLIFELPCRVVFSRSHPLSHSVSCFMRSKDMLQRKYSERSKVSL